MITSNAIAAIIYEVHKRHSCDTEPMLIAAFVDAIEAESACHCHSDEHEGIHFITCPGRDGPWNRDEFIRIATGGTDE